MYRQVGGCNPIVIELITGIKLLVDDWWSNPFVRRYVELASTGDKRIGGPLLVIQGEADPNMSFTSITSAVDKLVQAFPDSQLDYVTLPGVAHTSSLFASQRL